MVAASISSKTSVSTKKSSQSDILEVPGLSFAPSDLKTDHLHISGLNFASLDPNEERKYWNAARILMPSVSWGVSRKGHESIVRAANRIDRLFRVLINHRETEAQCGDGDAENSHERLGKALEAMSLRGPTDSSVNGEQLYGVVQEVVDARKKWSFEHEEKVGTKSSPREAEEITGLTLVYLSTLDEWILKSDTLKSALDRSKT